MSCFTREPAISTRKPSQPRSSQNSMMSHRAARVAKASGLPAGCCQGWLHWP